MLSSSLTSQIEELASAQEESILERYDERTAKLRAQMNAERANIQDEMQRLSALNEDYRQLSSAPLGLDKDTLIGGVSFVVGLTYVSAAINGLLQLGTPGAGSSLPTVALNALLGAVGVGYYFYRKPSK